MGDNPRDHSRSPANGEGEPTLKLLGWHDVRRHPAWRAGDVADLRPRDRYLAGRPRGAVSLPVDGKADADAFAAALPAVLLPPRLLPLLLVGDAPDLVAAAVLWLRGRGRADVDGAVLKPEDAPAGAWETGPPPDGRALWRPPEFLAAHADLLPPPEAGPVIDLGCGGGRASVWLAQRGYAVTAVDRLPDALALCRRLAAAAGVRVETMRRDLSGPGAAPPGPWSAALAFRFLDRRLLASLPDLLAPGGTVMIRTFRYDPRATGLPRRRHCLEAGELSELFPASRYEVLVSVEDADPDGRPAAGAVARLRPIPGTWRRWAGTSHPPSRAAGRRGAASR